MKGVLSKEITEETKKIFQASKIFCGLGKSKIIYDGDSVHVGSLSYEIRRNDGNFEIYYLQPDLDKVDGFSRRFVEAMPVESI
ncbi:hypothetical protein A3K64_00920 [Candidatus Micrarchaeota archaeon RBG_16_36_9]|nr:MAG: hypothetical protein A3K64_00920 [Candidatus Micrarchaeota archaeon RBG_16_36_9]